MRRAGPRLRLARQKRLAALGDVQHDGAGFKQHEAVFLKDRHLAERLQSAIFWLLLIAQPQQARAIGKAGFFQCPAHAQIAHLALGEVRHVSESGNRDHGAPHIVGMGLQGMISTASPGKIVKCGWLRK